MNMALVHFGSVPFEASLVVFDKDGTLIDFDSMWGRLAVLWVQRLAASAGDEALASDLYRSFGYDPVEQRTDPQGPLAIATTAQIAAIAAGALYRHGIPWPDAEDRVRLAFRTGPGLASLIRPAGNVAANLQRLHHARVRVAVVTTDYRSDTEETLRLLGISDMVDSLVCGDDGMPGKPAPDMLLTACQSLGVPPQRTAVVGDTLGDLLMAERAGAGLRVAVLSGAGTRELLEAHADVVLQSIDEITVE
jgi:phosphoglycolate phosphatase